MCVRVGRLYNWLEGWMSGWVIVWVSELMNGSIQGCIWVHGCMDGWWVHG